MDEYTVEIDELHDDVVIPAVPALRLLVFGRSIEEAMARASGHESVGYVDRGLTVLSSLVAGHGTTPTTQPVKPTSPYSRDQLRYRVSQPLESRV
jgi:hypothetical protein